MSPKIVSPTVEQILALQGERIRHLETADKWQFGEMRNAKHFAVGSLTGGIQEAHANLPAGGGTILIAEDIAATVTPEITSDNVTLLAVGGATILQTTAGQRALHIHGSGIILTDTYTVAIVAGDITITVNNGALFAAGDTIRIESDLRDEFAIVESVAGNVLTLENSVKFDHALGVVVNVHRMGMIKNVRLLGVNLDMVNGIVGNALAMQYAQDCSLDGVRIVTDDPAYAFSLLIDQSWWNTFNDIDIRGDGGYGILLTGGENNFTNIRMRGKFSFPAFNIASHLNNITNLNIRDKGVGGYGVYMQSGASFNTLVNCIVDRTTPSEPGPAAYRIFLTLAQMNDDGLTSVGNQFIGCRSIKNNMAFMLTNACHDTLIEGGWASGCYEAFAEVMSSSRVKIIGCHGEGMTDVVGGGVHAGIVFSVQVPACVDCIVDDCTFIDFARLGTADNCGIWAGNLEDSIISNVIVRGSTGGSGILLRAETDGVKVHNCDLRSNKYGIWNLGTDNRLLANVCLNNVTQNLFDQGVDTVVDHNITM